MYALSVSNSSHPPSNTTTTNEMMLFGEEGPRGVYMLGHRGVIRVGRGKSDSTAGFVGLSGLSGWGPSASAAIESMVLSDEGGDVTDGVTDNVTDERSVGVMAVSSTGQSLVIEHTEAPTTTAFHGTRHRHKRRAVSVNESTPTVRVITPDIYLNGSGAGPYFVCGMRPGPTASRVEGRFQCS